MQKKQVFAIAQADLWSAGRGPGGLGRRRSRASSRGVYGIPMKGSI